MAARAAGAVLISGGPLVAVGKVHGVEHALIAGAGLVLALIGVGLAIWTTSTVLSPRLTTPATLRSPALAELRTIIEADPAQFFGPVATTVDALLLHREVTVTLARLLAVEKEPAKRRMIERQFQRAKANAERAAPYVRWLLARARLADQEGLGAVALVHSGGRHTRDRRVGLVLRRDERQWPNVRAGANAIADGQPVGCGYPVGSVAGTAEHTAMGRLQRWRWGPSRFMSSGLALREDGDFGSCLAGCGRALTRGYYAPGLTLDVPGCPH